MADALVTIDPPASGTQATATASVGVNGSITSITITDPGSGYTSAPVVAITGSGTGALATATFNPTGSVTSVAVSLGGSGYIQPLVNITDPGLIGTGATATAFGEVEASPVNCSLNPNLLPGASCLVLTAAGADYHVPTVAFDLPDDPNGTQPTAHVVCVEGTVDSPCSNPNPDGTPGVVTITDVVLDSPGSGYSSAPGVAILDGTQFDPIRPGGSGAITSATLTIKSVRMDTFGTGYTAAEVSFSDNLGIPTTDAVATATVEAGAITAITVDPLNPGSGYMTTGGIKKFQDGLPVLCIPSANFSECTAQANNLGQYIPIAVPDTTTFPGTDYYVIAVVQHRERMSSSLPATGTLMRVYVQLETSVNASVGKHVALQTAMLDGTTTPTLMPDGSQAYALDDPHFLGPIILAQRDRAVRIVFYNLLPTGVAGDLFLPTDTTIMGSGMTPGAMDPVDEGTVMDYVRNPMCTEKYVDGTMRDMCFTENRATLHLHGGVTPWISDGTPHQWITPANESTPWPQGVSVGNVPDMAPVAGVPDCTSATDGCQTFYYTNQQSARLMFYHDHAWGITRLNVYAGEAAGYLITDPTEAALMAGPLAGLGYGIPLVIQDRTFVPDAAQLAAQDPTWDSTRWGGYGNFWYHHVYMPAQNPGDPSGMSAYGRWMYGPWFWPPATPIHGPIANPYYNMDPATNFTTPLAVPCNLDDPATWQYQTDPFCEPATIPGTPNISVGMEQFNDTPVVNGTAYPTVTLDPKTYRLRILNAANDRFWNLQWYVADPRTLTDSEVALNPTELAAAQTDPNVVPTPDTLWSPAGPKWIQIGTEGGFLPAPVVIPNQPITWIIDPTRFDVGNVDKHSLLLAPAERADVIVDFSQYAGKTLILYNDAPAAFPARVASYDYYLGAPDMSPVGAPTILPGYGPNTRTIMQVKVAATPPAPAFNLTALNNAFKHHANGSGVFESGQHPIIVGQAAYNSAYGTNFAASSWCNNPSAPINRCDGFARISEQGGDLFGFNTLKFPNAKMQIPLQPKALHDEMNSAAFDEFGRMTANLGLEAVPATPAGQTIILYPYVNPSTELIDATNLPKGDINVTPISSAADGTQIWKITHNGVDTHPIHFHLYDVQILNRVTWDNIIIPPEGSELGWKDTIRVSPLEDTIVALRPIIPTLPFELPNSIRELNPMLADGSTVGFNNIDKDGNPTTPIVNQLVNFGWEYVYHCHILSHEEMDMMRPVSVALPPNEPTGLAFDTATATLSWNDNSINETSFDVERSEDGGITWSIVGTDPSPLAQANTHGVRSLIDTTYSPSIDYQYRVVARNTVGYGLEFMSMTVQKISLPVIVSGTFMAPSNLTAVLDIGPTITLNWQDNTATELGFIVERSDNGGAFTQIGTTLAGVTTYVDSTGTLNNTYAYRVAAFNALGNSPYSNTVQVSPPVAPTSLTAVLTNGPTITLGWQDNSNNETGFIVERSDNGGAFTQIGTTLVGIATYVDSTGTQNNTYAYRVAAFNPLGNSPYTNTVQVSPPAAPTSLTAVLTLGPTISLGWTDNSTNATGFIVERSDNGGAFTQIGTTIAGVTTYLDSTGTLNNTYAYRVAAFNALGNSPYSNTVQVSPPVAPTSLTAVLTNGPTITLGWQDNSNNETGFIVERSDNGGAFTQIGTTLAGVATYVDSTGTQNNTYAYRVAAFNPLGNSPYTNTVQVSPPAAPTSLTVALTFGPTITLNWVDNSTNETSFVVERAIGSGAFSTLATVGANVTQYVDLTGGANTTYRYRVAANNPLGNSAFSNTVQVVVPAAPLAPTNLTAVLQTGLQVRLTWRDNANNETGFIVERSTDGINFTQIAAPGARPGQGNVIYVDTPVMPGFTYTYRVAARNAIVKSGYSAPAAVAVPALPAAPTILTAVAARRGITSERVTVTWSAVLPPLTGYTIQWSTTSNFAVVNGTGNVGPNTTTFRTGTINLQVWWFRVGATNLSGTTWSAPIQVAAAP
jgi:FtsP/CotA-like multicopper oxidase with cupredoxin domain